MGKFIKALICLIAEVIIKGLIFFKIYNWFVPVLLPAFPELNKIQSIGVTIVITFILCDKCDHIYDIDEDIKDKTLVSFICDVSMYLLYFLLAFVIKLIIGI